MSRILKIIMKSTDAPEYAVIRAEFYDIKKVIVENDDKSITVYGNIVHMGLLSGCDKLIDMSYLDSVLKYFSGVEGCDMDLEILYSTELPIIDYLELVDKHSISNSYSLHYITDYLFYAKTIGFYKSYHLEDLLSTKHVELDGDFLKLYGYDYVLTYKITNRAKFAKKIMIKKG